jgi:hypothetical protein
VQITHCKRVVPLCLPITISDSNEVKAAPLHGQHRQLSAFRLGICAADLGRDADDTEGCRPAVIEAFGNTFSMAQLGNARLAWQAIQNDADPLPS